MSYAQGQANFPKGNIGVIVYANEYSFIPSTYFGWKSYIEKCVCAHLSNKCYDDAISKFTLK